MVFSPVVIEHERQVVGHRCVRRLARGWGRGQELFEAIAHRANLGQRGETDALIDLGERLADRGDEIAANAPAPAEIEVAPRERVGVEAMIDDELGGDARDAARREVAVLREHERRLEVVVERHDAPPVERESARRSLPIEVDEDAVDDHALLDAPRARERLGGRVVVRATAAEDLEEHGLVDGARADVGVQRVDERVGLGVVTEERLLLAYVVAGAHRRASLEKRGELVPELIFDRAKTEAKQILQVRLEREAVPGDPVEAELVLEATPHLLG